MSHEDHLRMVEDLPPVAAKPALLAALTEVARLKALFTWEMYDALRFCAARTRAHAAGSPVDLQYADDCDAAAARISSVLPPREPPREGGVYFD